MVPDLRQFLNLKGVSPAEILLHKHIATGGISDLWLASHPAFEGYFVVKYSRTPQTPYIYGQFEREYECAQVLAQKGLEQIATHIFTFDVDEDGHPYLIEEYFPSESLDIFMHCNHDWNIIRIYLRDIIRCIARMHTAEIIHRDLKPGNILIGEDGDVRIIDFALAAIKGEWHPGHEPGTAIGTPLYMSPEQAFGSHAELTNACDWYALGIILFEWLTGHVPFKGNTAKETMQMHCFKAPPLPHNTCIPNAPACLPDIVRDMLSKDPKPRLGAVRQLASHLI